MRHVTINCIIPKVTPAKFGAMSTMLASVPAETAPCSASESVRKTTAVMTLQPE